MLEVRLLDDRDTWNSWIAEQPTGNILQSYEWGQFKSSLGWKTLRLAACNGGRIVAGAQIFLRHVPIGTIAYCPRGPVFDPADPEPASRLIATAHDLSRAERAIFLKVEPPLPDSSSLRQMFADWGFRRGDEVQPRSTILVDISADLDVLSARLDVKTRYNVGLAGRKGVKIVEPDEDGVASFYAMLLGTSQRAGFAVHAPEYYDKVWKQLKSNNMAQLLLATYEDEVLAGALLLRAAGNAYYMYGASSGEHRNLKPSDLLQWECLKWAKSAGCTTYDMWGIPDEVDPAAETVHRSEAAEKSHRNGNGRNGSAHNGAKGSDSSLWGVYRFKRGFGGEIVRFVGAYDYVYSASRYLMWLGSTSLLRHFVSKVGKGRQND